MRSIRPVRSNCPTGRRAILSGGIASLAALLTLGAAPDPHEGEDPHCAPEPEPGHGDRQGKFDENGRMRIWPGNTTICPFPLTHPLAQAMLEMNRLVTTQYAAYIAPTPSSSYHMTILGGVDPEQIQKGTLPVGIAPSIPLDTSNRILCERLARERFDIPEKIEMEIDPDRHHAPLVGAPLRPANAAIATALYDLRRQIAECMQFHPDDLMRYMFHATYGYKYRHLPYHLKPGLRSAVHEWRRAASERLGVFTVPAPVFCSFDTMGAFTPLLALQGRA